MQAAQPRRPAQRPRLAVPPAKRWKGGSRLSPRGPSQLVNDWTLVDSQDAYGRHRVEAPVTSAQDACISRFRAKHRSSCGRGFMQWSLSRQRLRSQARSLRRTRTPSQIGHEHAAKHSRASSAGRYPHNADLMSVLLTPRRGRHHITSCLPSPISSRNGSSVARRCASAEGTLRTAEATSARNRPPRVGPRRSFAGHPMTEPAADVHVFVASDEATRALSVMADGSNLPRHVTWEHRDIVAMIAEHLALHVTNAHVAMTNLIMRGYHLSGRSAHVLRFPEPNRNSS